MPLVLCSPSHPARSGLIRGTCFPRTRSRFAIHARRHDGQPGLLSRPCASLHLPRARFRTRGFPNPRASTRFCSSTLSSLLRRPPAASLMFRAMPSGSRLRRGLSHVPRRLRLSAGVLGLPYVRQTFNLMFHHVLTFTNAACVVWGAPPATKPPRQLI